MANVFSVLRYNSLYLLCDEMTVQLVVAVSFSGTVASCCCPFKKHTLALADGRHSNNPSLSGRACIRNWGRGFESHGNLPGRVSPVKDATESSCKGRAGSGRYLGVCCLTIDHSSVDVSIASLATPCTCSTKSLKCPFNWNVKILHLHFNPLTTLLSRGAKKWCWWHGVNSWFFSLRFQNVQCLESSDQITKYAVWWFSPFKSSVWAVQVPPKKFIQNQKSFYS